MNKYKEIEPHNYLEECIAVSLCQLNGEKQRQYETQYNPRLMKKERIYTWHSYIKAAKYAIKIGLDAYMDGLR